jgi:hypothetical protein
MTSNVFVPMLPVAPRTTTFFARWVIPEHRFASLGTCTKRHQAATSVPSSILETCEKPDNPNVPPVVRYFATIQSSRYAEGACYFGRPQCFFSATGVIRAFSINFLKYVLGLLK